MNTLGSAGDFWATEDAAEYYELKLGAVWRHGFECGAVNALRSALSLVDLAPTTVTSITAFSDKLDFVARPTDEWDGNLRRYEFFVNFLGSSIRQIPR